MNVKTKGTYLVCGQEFCALVRFAGEFPHFVIVSGIELSAFIQRGDVVALDKNSVELAMIAEYPDDFVYIPFHEAFSDMNLSGLKHGKRNESVEFDRNEEAQWIEYYKEIVHFGLPMNKLAARIMYSGRSYGQAQLLIDMIAKKVAKDRMKSIERELKARR